MMEIIKLKEKKLYLSFVNSKDWRTEKEKKMLQKDRWRKIRQKVMENYDYTCQYCGFKNLKWQIAHHINHNKKDNKIKNLAVMCQMCNVIHHAGIGCVVFGVVDLYKESKYNQNKIVKITRKMRQERKKDDEIIRYLGLKEMVEFRMKKAYLKRLFGFVTDKFEDKQKVPLV